MPLSGLQIHTDKQVQGPRLRACCTNYNIYKHPWDTLDLCVSLQSQINRQEPGTSVAEAPLVRLHGLPRRRSGRSICTSPTTRFPLLRPKGSRGWAVGGLRGRGSRGGHGWYEGSLVSPACAALSPPPHRRVGPDAPGACRGSQAEPHRACRQSRMPGGREKERRADGEERKGRGTPAWKGIRERRGSREKRGHDFPPARRVDSRAGSGRATRGTERMRGGGLRLDPEE
jgi:hypothetical protein